MAQNVYIHIPFCRQKCNYCSFISFPEITKKEQYLKAVKEEIIAKYKNEVLKTLYIGGGTPSLLNIEDLKFLIENFNTNEETEITIELNPESLTENYLSQLHKTGFNRISLGCQTFDDMILKNIGRKHNSIQVIQAVKIAQNIGFKNINLDFIYGLPEQTLTGFIKDLKTAIELDIQHISLYGLKIDEGCYFYNHYPKNLPDDDIQATMYIEAVKLMKENSFIHYEISNFARQGFNSRHNLNYWDNNSYYGFGTAAHGYIDDIRYSNSCTIDDYIKNPLRPAEFHSLSGQEKLEEEIFLGFRKMSGINIENINNTYKIDFEDKYRNILEKYTNSGHIVKINNNYSLTTKGILVSNYILADFLE